MSKSYMEWAEYMTWVATALRLDPDSQARDKGESLRTASTKGSNRRGGHVVQIDQHGSSSPSLSKLKLG